MTATTFILIVKSLNEEVNSRTAGMHSSIFAKAQVQIASQRRGAEGLCDHHLVPRM